MTFHAYDNALALNAALLPSLLELRTHNASLADQLKRAASSIALNVAEGARRSGKDRLHFFRIAAGSAAEVRAALDVARSWREVRQDANVDRLLDRELGLLYGLTHKR